MSFRNARRFTFILGNFFLFRIYSLKLPQIRKNHVNKYTVRLCACTCSAIETLHINYYSEARSYMVLYFFQLYLQLKFDADTWI